MLAWVPVAWADDFVIFRPVEARAEPSNWKQAFKGVGGKHAGLIAALARYETEPSIETALPVLSQFGKFAGDKALREAAFATNLDLFLTLDALKYELVLQTNLELSARRRAKGQAEIEYSFRVGSSGDRYRQWLDWAHAGRPLDRMPITDSYRNDKLFQSDDDVTNRVRPDALAAEPSAEELLNGETAAGVFAQVTAGYGVKIDAKALKVEFLSPTKAYSILRSREPSRASQWPHYLEAWARANEEKYNGIFAEEQLHAWGMEKGTATRLAGLVRGAATIEAVAGGTTSYRESALGQRYGDELFPRGVNDVAGWMANNYRQIFVVHQGDLQSLAKYTLRMIEWWDKFDFDAAKEMKKYGQKLPVEFAQLRKLLDAIRNPKSPKDYAAAIDKVGGAERALQVLRDANMAILLGGHRKHVDRLAGQLKKALTQHFKQAGAEPPTVDDLLRGAAGDELLMSLDALAGAYANLPEEAAQRVNQDLAEFVRKIETGKPAEGVYEADLRKYLMLSIEKARAAAGELAAEVRGFEDINRLRARLADVLNDHLRAISDGADLDSYILQVAQGQMKQRRLRLMWDEPAQTWPRVAWADEQWKPEDVAIDMRRIHALTETFGWSNETYARRLKDYFDGPKGGQEWSTLAVSTLRELYNFYDPARMKSRTVELTKESGEVVRFVLQPTGGRAEASVNLGLLGFKMAIKGGGAVMKGWQIWGDLSDARMLAKSLKEVALPTPGQTAEERAQAQAMALSKTISLFQYAEYLSAAAKNPVLFEKMGGTLSTAAALAADPFDQSAVDQLSIAFLKDLMLWVQPELAAAFVAYDIYEWGSAELRLSYAKSDFVALLVENGEWDTSGKRPVLQAVLAGNLRIPDDPAKRADRCRARELAARSTGAFTAADAGEIGLTWLAKLPSSFVKDGIELRKSKRKVKSRDALLDIFYGEDYEGRDAVIQITMRAVNDLPRAGLIASSRGWTKAWLEDLGVFVPTTEDATRIAREPPIRVTPAEKLVETGGGPMEPSFTLNIHQLAGVPEGARKNFGFLVSEYWTRRQHIVECRMLDQLIEEATRAKEDEEAADPSLSELLAALQKLEERMQDLDKRVWPEIARSADPFPGPDYDPETNLPITDDYLERTKPERALIQQIAAYAVDPSPANEEALRATLFGPRQPAESAEELAAQLQPLDQQNLRRRAGEALQKLLKTVRAYEKSYGEVVAALADANDYVASQSSVDATVSAGTDAPGFVIGPGFHLQLQPSLGTLRAPPSAEEYAGTDLYSFIYGDQDVIRAEAWRDRYKGEYDRVRQDLGSRLQAFHQRLRPLVSLTDLPAAAADKVAEWVNWWNTTGPYELALQHPYWPRLMRLRFQIRKLEDMLPTAGDATKEELAEAVTPMVLGQERGAQLLERLGAGGLAALKSEMEQEYERLLKLAEGMFEMALTVTPADELRVTDRFAASLENRRKEELRGPDAAEIAGLVRRYWWELVPASGGEPADPRCVHDIADWFWFSEFVDAPSGSNQGQSAGLLWEKRLLQAGPYRLRVTALGADDIPLAQVAAPIELAVKPATLAGTLDVTGDWQRSADEGQVSVFMGPSGRDDPSPRFRLGDPGPFEGPICDFAESEIPSAVAKNSGPFAPPSLSAYAGVEASGGTLDPRSKTFAATYQERARFVLDEPLQLHFRQPVAITVNVKDASGIAIDGAEITARSGETSVATPAALSLPLKADDRVRVEVRYDAGAFVVEAKSASVIYDPKVNGQSLTFDVELPFFAVGNLKVTGRFSSSAAGPQVAGGRLRPDFAAELAAAAGGAFEIVNERPLRLSDKIALAAVLWDADDFLLGPAEGKVVRELKRGAVRDLGEISLRRLELKVENIQISVRDWTKLPMPEIGTRVRLRAEGAEREARRTGPGYLGSWIFTRRLEEVEIAAEYAMPAGEPVTGTATLSLDQMGDLFAPRAPQTPYDVAMKVYLPGSLKLRGRVEVEAPAGASLPVGATLTAMAGDAPASQGDSVVVGQSIEFDLDAPIRVGEPLKIVAEAEAGGAPYAGTASASAPAMSGPGPFGIADFGVVKLMTTVEFVQLPVVVGKTLEQALDIVGKAGFAPAHQQPDKRPEKKEESLIVYQQSPITAEGEIMRLPRGAPVSVWAYGEYKRIVVPNVAGKGLTEAVEILSKAGLTNIGRNRLGPPGEGQKSLVVETQAPEAGAEVAPEDEVVLRFYELSAEDIARLWAGPWTGGIRLRRMTVGSFQATNYAAFEAEFFRMNEELSRGDAVVDENRSALGTAFGTLIGSMTKEVRKMVFTLVLSLSAVAFDGGPIGFAFEPVDEGLRLVFPGMDPQAANAMYAADSPWRPFRFKDERTLESEMRVVQGKDKPVITIVMAFSTAEDFSAGRLLVTVHSTDPSPKPGQSASGQLLLEGDLVPGAVDFKAITAAYQKQIEAKQPLIVPKVEQLLGD